MTKLRVTISGVSAIGPGRPRPKPKDDDGHYERPGPLFVVFPAATRRGDSLGSGYIPVHIPVLITKTKVTDKSRRPDESVKGDSGYYNVWYPMRERLVFSFQEAAYPKTLIYQHDPQYSGIDMPDGDIDYVADMRDVWWEKRKMPTRMRDLGRHPKKVPGHVSGQIFVPGGIVRSDFGKKKKQHVKFMPPKGDTPHEMYIAANVAVDCEVKGVTIHSWSLDTGERLDPIIFPDDAKIEIFFGNADPPDMRIIIGAGGWRRVADPTREGARDGDFELYYSLLAQLETTDLPVPVHTGRIGFGPIRNCYGLMTM